MCSSMSTGVSGVLCRWWNSLIATNFFESVEYAS